MIDPNLIRWINASVNKFLTDNATPYKLHISGQELDFDSLPQSWAELHVSALDLDEVTSGSYEIDLILTVMCTALFTNDDYLIHRISGQFQGLLSGSILVYRYGDDNGFIGCLQPQKKARVQPFGPMQIDGAKAGPIRVKSQSVEQEFHMSI